MVKLYCWLERLGRVATLTTVGAENVGSMLGGSGNSATALVAAGAGSGRSFEDSINVTTLAGHVVVLADEFEPGSKVVESATNLSHGGRTPT